MLVMSSIELLDKNIVNVSDKSFKLANFYEDKLHDRTIHRITKVEEHYCKIFTELSHNLDELDSELDTFIKTLGQIESQSK